jgi:hypothetical protein
VIVPPEAKAIRLLANLFTPHPNPSAIPKGTSVGRRGEERTWHCHRLKTDGCPNSNPLKGFNTFPKSPFIGLDFKRAAGFEPAAAQNTL